jgi:hypothetical protein
MSSPDVEAARAFVCGTGRPLERHRLAALCGSPVSPVLDALAPYRNEDGGFGHALEPDVRAPHSEPIAALAALDVLAEVNALDHVWVSDLAGWIETIALDDGGIPFLLPAGERYPRGPWMQSGRGGSHLTFGLAAKLHEAARSTRWLKQATGWCWSKLEGGGEVGPYTLRFALDFLDAVPEPRRADAAIERLGNAQSPTVHRRADRGGPRSSHGRAATRRRLDLRLARLVTRAGGGVARDRHLPGARGPRRP